MVGCALLLPAWPLDSTNRLSIWRAFSFFYFVSSELCACTVLTVLFPWNKFVHRDSCVRDSRLWLLIQVFGGKWKGKDNLVVLWGVRRCFVG